MAAFWRTLDLAVAACTRAGTMLVLPVSLLLFLQWPLRDLVQAGSREANDLAQCLFALYVSCAITFATRTRAHLATDVFAQRYAPRTRALLYRVASLFVLLPWAAFILYAAWPAVVQSSLQLEAFPETYNPGYFVVKIALLLLAFLVLAQALLDALRPDAAARGRRVNKP
jgi:TRAP-type mannitol/chloroaromatic compound transport system permease small subunit